MFDIFKIISWLKKNFTKRDILFLVLLLTLFFLTRLINIENFPIFNDEGIYIRWAKTAWRDASWRFISLTDGKQPLQTWMTIPLLKLFPDNALLAGRLFAVVTGLMAFSGIFTLLFYLFGKKAAYIGLLLYVFTPYFLFYDRLALMDSAVNAGFIWILFFSILLAKTVRLDVALIFGMVAGLALLTKSSAQVFIALVVLGPVFYFTRNKLVYFSKGNSFKKILQKTANYYLLYLIVVGMAVVIYNVQRLSPFLHFVAEKNKVFLLSFSDFLKSPFLVFFHNVKTLPLYVFWEMGFALGLIGFLGWFLLWKKDRRLFLYITLWILLLYLGVSLFTRVLFPRYLIFFASLFLIMAAYLMNYLKNKGWKIFFTAVLAISFLFFDYPILFNIENIPFPPVDRGQYLEGWTAGWGMREIIGFVREKSREKPVILLAEGDFGMSGDVLNVFLKKNDRIFIKGYWPLTEKDLVSNQKELADNHVYIVITHQDKLPTNWPMKLIAQYEKPNHQATAYLLELAK